MYIILHLLYVCKEISAKGLKKDAVCCLSFSCKTSLIGISLSRVFHGNCGQLRMMACRISLGHHKSFKQLKSLACTKETWRDFYCFSFLLLEDEVLLVFTCQCYKIK